MAELVTCVIPVHNGQYTILAAIQSAFNGGCNFVSVYEDGSTDNTLDVLEKHAKEYPNLEVYADMSLHMRRGVNYGRNYLCQHARDGLIIPLDVDDILRDIMPL